MQCSLLEKLHKQYNLNMFSMLDQTWSPQKKPQRPQNARQWHDFFKFVGASCDIQKFTRSSTTFCFKFWKLYLKSGNKQKTMYRVGQKTWHFTYVHIFTNYWSIFKILSPAHSVDNLQQRNYYICHHNVNASLHYLVKCQWNMHMLR